VAGVGFGPVGFGPAGLGATWACGGLQVGEFLQLWERLCAWWLLWGGHSYQAICCDGLEKLGGLKAVGGRLEW